VHIVKKLIPLCAVAASLTGVLLAAGPASAAPVYAKGGSYQFASNYTDGSSSPWLVSNSPFSYQDASQSLGANGVTLSAVTLPPVIAADTFVVRPCMRYSMLSLYDM